VPESRSTLEDPTRWFRLDGKVVLITGASSGLGLGFAWALAGAGASVMLAARRADRLKAAVDALTTAGARAAFEPVDVTRPDDCERLVAATIERLALSRRRETPVTAVGRRS
jgi:NADP-dependent 3-hydroxy acid dehydrogenase YdfG